MKSDIQQPNFLSVPAAARLCGVSRNTVYTWVRDGKLSAYQTPGRTNLIRPRDLVDFMQKCGMFVPPELSDLAREDQKLDRATPDAEKISADPAVLVVDDEPTIRAMVVRMLRETFPIMQAETGYEAMHLMTVHKNIRLVLLDLHMPGQHGLSTLKEIRASRPDISVVIVTGYEGEIPPEMLRDGTITRLITKPFQADELRKVVADLMRAK